MKLGTRLCSAALSLFMLFSAAPWTAAEAGSAQTNGDDQIYLIAPQTSEGIEYDADSLKNLVVEGRLEGDTFTFSKDAALRFTFRMQEGWRFCEDFSVLFPSDREHVTLQSNADTVTLTYQAVKGRSIPFDDLEDVFLNATPEKLPRLDITVEGGFGQINKQDWIPAHYKLTNGSKQYASADYEGDGEIKGRGNTSWGFAQKPYSIKLGAKASLLDIPGTKKYAIVSPEADPSLLRNYITYKAGLELTGIGYTPKVEQVEVWLNGSYNGVYALVERIDIESTKIDIPEAVDKDVITNLTGGYIIEKDAGDKVDKGSDPWFACPYQANPNEDLFTLKAPDLPADQTEARKVLDYLTGYMEKVDGAIMGTSGEDYKKYVDIDSWVDFVIIQEIAKNIDGNLKTSCYMYKEPDNDTLYMTALWDFDNAYGAAGWDNKAPGRNDVDDCPNGTGTEDFMVINSSCPWYKKLYSIPEFKQALQERYTQYRTSLIENMLHRIDTGAAYMQAAAVSQNDKWGRLGNYADRVSTLRGWLEGRLTWLDSQWLLDTPQTHTVTVTVEGQGAVTRQQGDGPVEDRQTAVYTVQPAKGYQLTSVVFDGVDLTQRIAGDTFTTPILTNDAALTVTFEKEPPVLRAIALTETGRGSVVLSKTEAYAGDKVDFTVTAQAGYGLKNLTITGKTTGQTVNYTPSAAGGTFVMPDEDVEVAAVFEKEPPVLRAIALTETGRGSVALSKTEAYAGDEVDFTVTVQAGYELKSLTITGKTTGETVDYAPSAAGGTFVMPDEDVEVAAVFEKSTPALYTVAAAAAEGGRVVLSAGEAEAGDTVTIQLTPDSGYKEASLVIVGKASGKPVEYQTEPSGRYAFTMPAEDVEITAVFMEIPAVNVPGDLDGDGEVTIQDVMEACKVLARQSAGKTPTADEMAWGNLDGDDAFTIGDVMEICKILARKA